MGNGGGYERNARGGKRLRSITLPSLSHHDHLRASVIAIAPSPRLPASDDVRHFAAGSPRRIPLGVHREVTVNEYAGKHDERTEGWDVEGRGYERRVWGARQTNWERERNKGRGHERGHERTGNAGRGRRERTVDASDHVRRADAASTPLHSPPPLVSILVINGVFPVHTPRAKPHSNSRLLPSPLSPAKNLQRRTQTQPERRVRALNVPSADRVGHRSSKSERKRKRGCRRHERRANERIRNTHT